MPQGKKRYRFGDFSNPLSFTISHADSLTHEQLSFSKRACIPPLVWFFDF